MIFEKSMETGDVDRKRRGMTGLAQVSTICRLGYLPPVVPSSSYFDLRQFEVRRNWRIGRRIARKRVPRDSKWDLTRPLSLARPTNVLPFCGLICDIKNILFCRFQLFLWPEHATFEVTQCWRIGWSTDFRSTLEKLVSGLVRYTKTDLTSKVKSTRSRVAEAD